MLYMCYLQSLSSLSRPSRPSSVKKLLATPCQIAQISNLYLFIYFFHLSVHECLNYIFKTLVQWGQFTSRHWVLNRAPALK